MLDLVDSTSLPVKYGGSCLCPGGCEHANIGPWNDGSVEGYPIQEWEELFDKDLVKDSGIGLS